MGKPWERDWSGGQAATNQPVAPTEGSPSPGISLDAPSTNIDPQSGDVTTTQPVPPAASGMQSTPFSGGTNSTVFKNLAKEDSDQHKAYLINRVVAQNVFRILDHLEQNYDKFPTGGWGKDALAGAAQTIAPNSDWAVGSNSIQKGTNDLAMELGKFQTTPGSRGSVLALSTILASKPGLQQVEPVNKDISSGIRAKVTDYLLGQELAQKYRERSPNQVTDSRTYDLDDALRSLYPLEAKDQKTGRISFNQQNIRLRRAAMNDALVNPQKYLDAASKVAAQPQAQTQPTTTNWTFGPDGELVQDGQ